jgi:alkyl sulfatase BDS1-like metallo-beta-lactamase superfamily hydrolase
MTDPLPDSISAAAAAAGPQGQVAHPDAIEHLDRLQRKFYRVGEHAWCLVGNGLSNQTFVEGPDGIIAIDTGESVEEMREAISELRQQTDKPIVACIYSHFHYISGTTAIMEEPRNAGLQIYGHAGIEDNLTRFGGEVAPRSSRGLVHQFGVMLPDGVADGLLHAGLGLFFRNPAHAPFTNGYIPAQHTFERAAEFTIAGLRVEMTPAPSDATDSITIWFPELRLCVNNLIWPSLFNVYAVRGEEYRDPRILLEGIDALYELQAEHLIGTHGPPLSGARIGPAVLDYRDAIQFLWDQTVRCLNQGMWLDEVTLQVQLPQRFDRSYFTRQFYGLAEHHVRQIHAGLFGWLDEDESHLFPLPGAERCQRLIAGFGGADAVREQTDSALAAEDWRWAAELASWLYRVDSASEQDRKRLAAAMRGIARHTTSANIRNHCLTRALELEGTLDLSRFRVHRFRYDEVLSAPPTRFIPVLRVLLDPDQSGDLEEELTWHFSTGERAGLRIRGPVAIPTDGSVSELVITLSPETWAAWLSGKTTFSAAEAEGIISTSGDLQRIKRFLASFDHPAFS